MTTTLIRHCTCGNTWAQPEGECPACGSTDYEIEVEVEVECMDPDCRPQHTHPRVMSDEPAALPDWAEEWLRGRCGCGARLCRPACHCGGHVACSASGTSPEKCEANDD